MILRRGIQVSGGSGWEEVVEASLVVGIALVKSSEGSVFVDEVGVERE